MSQVDYSDDYQHWDNTEPVTVTIKRANPVTPGSPVTTAIPVALAIRDDLERKLFPLVEVRSSEDACMWSVPCALLVVSATQHELQLDDRVTDADSVVWIVVDLKLIRVGTSKLHWIAACVKQRS